jgi:hypothetical protein
MDNIGSAFEMMEKQDNSNCPEFKRGDSVEILNPDYPEQTAVVVGFEFNMFNRPLIRVGFGFSRETVFYPYELKVISPK